MKHYLNVNYDGTIWEFSKEDKGDGWESYQNSKGETKYKKRHFSVTGVLTSIRTKTNDWKNGAEELEITLVQGDDTNLITLPVLANDGYSLDDHTESLVAKLGNMHKGLTYEVSAWYMKKGDVINGEEVRYGRKGVTVKLDGEKISNKMTYEYIKNRGKDNEEHVKGDVPMLQWKERAGKSKPTAASLEKKLDFLYDTMKNNIERINTMDSMSAVTENNEPDDLPF